MENKMHPLRKAGPLLMFLAVAIGAFGAHVLENKLGPKAIKTFQTGVTYHLIHALALLALTFRPTDLKLGKAPYFLLAGVVLFSGNCYLYALTQIKTFAMIVPVGGFSFLIGWALLLRDLK